MSQMLSSSKKYKGVIYKYTFPNGKVYIGQTINPRSRKSQHLCKSTGARNVAFWRAYEKYGSVEYEEIEHVAENTREELCDKLNDLEQKYIAEYKSTNPNYGYNLTSGGKIFIVTEEGRKHMSDARTDKVAILQYDLNGNLIAEHMSTVEAAKAVGSRPGTVWNCCVGKASGRRVKKTQIVKGFTFRFKSDFVESPSTIDLNITTNKKRVLQFSLDGKFIREWDSIIEIENNIKCHESGVRQCCYGKYRQSGGYMWRFRDEFDDIPKQIEPVKEKKKRPFPTLTLEQVEKGKRILREKYAKSVIQFDFDGSYIAKFSCIEEAAVTVKGDAASICNACKHERLKSAYGFQWRYADEIHNPDDGIEPYTIEYGPKKKVLQCTKDGVVIKEWDSAQEAALFFQVNRNTIYMALSGRKQYVRGFLWKYKLGD